MARRDARTDKKNQNEVDRHFCVQDQQKYSLVYKQTLQSVLRVVWWLDGGTLTFISFLFRIGNGYFTTAVQFKKTCLFLICNVNSRIADRFTKFLIDIVPRIRVISYFKSICHRKRKKYGYIDKKHVRENGKFVSTTIKQIWQWCL